MRWLVGNCLLNKQEKNLNLIEYINTAVKYKTKTVGKYQDNTRVDLADKLGRKLILGKPADMVLKILEWSIS